MPWVIVAMVVVMGLLMLFAFSAVLISIGAGLIVSALLWQPLRFWRRHQVLRSKALNPALDVNEALKTHPALFYVLCALVIWLGVVAMLATLIALPERMFAPDQLALGAGVAFVVSLGTLVRLIGNLLSVGKDAHSAADIKAAWALASWLVPMFTTIVLLFFAPHTAGWMVWRAEWRGYASTQLRIPLKNDDAQSRQALLDVVQPLLLQGSRVLRYSARSRSGNHYTLLGGMPARYRFHGGALEIQLAGLMDSSQLRTHQATLELAASGAMPDPSMLAFAQCKPSDEKMARSRLLSQGTQLMQEWRSCVQTKTESMRALMGQLKGNLGPIEIQRNWFSPKRSNGFQWAGWKAVDLPEGDELSALDTLR